MLISFLVKFSKSLSKTSMAYDWIRDVLNRVLAVCMLFHVVQMIYDVKFKARLSLFLSICNKNICHHF